MIRRISASAIVCALFAISMTAYAQGRPAGAGSQAGGRPSMSQQQDRSASMREEAELRRQTAKAEHLAAEADAEAKRVAAESNNISADMRALHAPSGRRDPNDHAAQDAFDAEANAINATEHGLTRRVTGDESRATSDGDDADEPDDD